MCYTKKLFLCVLFVAVTTAVVPCARNTSTTELDAHRCAMCATTSRGNHRSKLPQQDFSAFNMGPAPQRPLPVFSKPTEGGPLLAWGLNETGSLRAGAKSTGQDHLVNVSVSIKPPVCETTCTAREQWTPADGTPPPGDPAAGKSSAVGHALAAVQVFARAALELSARNPTTTTVVIVFVTAAIALVVGALVYAGSGRRRLSREVLESAASAMQLLRFAQYFVPVPQPVLDCEEVARTRVLVFCENDKHVVALAERRDELKKASAENSPELNNYLETVVDVYIEKFAFPQTGNRILGYIRSAWIDRRVEFQGIEARLKELTSQTHHVTRDQQSAKHMNNQSANRPAPATPSIISNGEPVASYAVTIADYTLRASDGNDLGAKEIGSRTRTERPDVDGSHVAVTKYNEPF